ncbi:hypothetical protein FCM35_KLT04997 [Carex littledalei]|uniref:Uncharacterized protein n=1 Tax=Carex littledalei TaxID=544730 RepID=A0A833V9E1_9POAL|nr:hypothetical protein FCM35_KLT04997 [Carex littledalei]
MFVTSSEFGGAWDSGGKAGIGAYLLCNGAVVCWISKAIEAVNPNQAEAKGVLEGYRLLVQWAKGVGTVCSDSMETVKSLQNRLPVINDWRSYEDIWAAWSKNITSLQSSTVAGSIWDCK